MAQPSTTITRHELSVPFSEFDLMMNQRGYIAPQVLKPRTVGLQSANIGKIPIEDLLETRDTQRAPKAGYARGDFEWTTYSYACKEYGFEEPMDDWTLALYADMIEAETIHSQRAAATVCDSYEADVASTIYDTAVWTGSALTTTITNEWDDHTNATPIADVIAAREKVIVGSGLEPNALIMNSYQYINLVNCDEIVDRVKYTARATQAEMRAAVADVLGLKYLLVAGGLKNTANAEQTASISRIWSSEYMMIARVAETEDPAEPCIGRTFIWSGDGPDSIGTDEKLALVTEEYRDEKVRGSVIRVRNNRDIQIMYPQAGHLLKNAITI